MAEMILPRRKFLTGLAALVAAPAIVRASSLMPVKSYDIRYGKIISATLDDYVDRILNPMLERFGRLTKGGDYIVNYNLNDEICVTPLATYEMYKHG